MTLDWLRPSAIFGYLKRAKSGSHLLSSTVDSEAVRFKKLVNEADSIKSSWRERAKLLIWDYQTATCGTWILIMILVGGGAVALGPPSHFYCLRTNDSLMAQLYSERIALIAQVSVGIVGAILVVTVFSVQLHSQREDEGAFMTRYLVRKHLIPWILGYSLGFSALVALLIMAEQLGFHVWWNASSVICLAGFTLLLVITFWFANESIKDATKSTLDIGFPLLCRDLSRIVAAD